MRGLPYVLVVLLSAPLLSGCISPQDEVVEEDPGVPSAMQAMTAAQDTLAMNGTGHVFYGMMGVESLAAGAFLQGRVPEPLRARLDTEDLLAGDGRTDSWLGFWKDAEGAPYLAVGGIPEIVPANGTEAYPFGRGFLNDMASRVPIGKGWIDSTRALQRAIRSDHDIRTMMEGFDVEILMVLQRYSDDPSARWTFILSPVQSVERHVVVVDASSGYPDSVYEGGEVLMDEHHDQTATPTEPATTRITLDEGAGVLFLEFEPTYGSARAPEIRVTVEHPDGLVETVDASKWPDPFAHRLTSLAPGDYIVQVRPVVSAGPLDVPIGEGVHTHWCAAGRMPDPTGATWTSGCDRYYEYM